MVSNKTLVLALFAVLFAGGIYFFAQEKQKQDSVRFIETESGDEYIPEDYATEEEINPVLDPNVPGFVAGETSADCDKIESAYMRAECYRNIALSNNDVSYCNNEIEEGQKDNCIYEVALKSNDVQTCFGLAYDVADCITEIAIATQSPQTCEEAGFEKPTCFRAVDEKDFELCKKTGIYRRFCNDAVDLQDKTQCENIPDGKEYCYYQLALSTNNAQYCQNSGELIEQNCIFSIAIETNNVQACNLLATSRDHCVASIALNTGNVSLCEQAGSEKQACIEDLLG